MKDSFLGTLAIDLGNTNTVIAFQEEKDIDPILISIPNITTNPGIIPTAVWFDNESCETKIGESALKMKNKPGSRFFFHSNFKRLIGNTFEISKKKL